MRTGSLLFSTLAALLLAPAAAEAQQQFRRVRLDQTGVQIGFQNVAINTEARGIKTGLWAPVLITFVEDPKGNIKLPVAVDGSLSGEVFVETADFDNANIRNSYPRKFNFAANDPMQVLTYVKVATTHAEIWATVKAGGKTFPSVERYCPTVGVGRHLYLALGDSLQDFQDALTKQKGKHEDNQGWGGMSRNVAYENNPQHLPDLWFGYNSVDLVILVTTNDKFIDRLIGDRQPSPQLAALAEWVRRGGRLVVSIAPTTREKVHRLLNSPAWQPALPPVLPLDSKVFPMLSLDGLRSWSAAGDKRFNPQPNKEGMGVRIQESPAVSVLVKESLDAKDSAPLIVRFPHGIGSITLLAFDVKDPFLAQWEGRENFWAEVVRKLAPESSRGQAGQPGDDDVRGSNGGGTDLTSRLYDQLESFDTPPISFGWVALFIFIYIIVIGPVDFLILKLVFKRLELTWLTFPAVVLTVSLLAYFTAYAIKGQDLKVNKVDLIDIDLRTPLGENLQPAAARAYGTTWFSIHSPRIQNYTIGIEPVLHNWQPGIAAPAQPVEPTMSWLGRPDYGGMGGGGRGGSSGLFNRGYNYEPNATGLRGVPIPVWTTRSFTASWEAAFDNSKLPFESTLTYQVGKRDSISGTIQSNLPFDLTNVGIIYRGQFFALPDLPKGATTQLKLDGLAGQQLGTWADLTRLGNVNPGRWDREGSSRSPGYFDPTYALRGIMFHEKVDSNASARNHAHRAHDWSWRLDDQAQDGRVKEIILAAHVGRTAGSLEQLHADNDPKLPTHLWLGEIPGTPGTKRPAMQGTLTQETYLRVILPVAPRK